MSFTNNIIGCICCFSAVCAAADGSFPSAVNFFCFFRNFLTIHISREFLTGADYG